MARHWLLIMLLASLGAGIAWLLTNSSPDPESVAALRPRMESPTSPELAASVSRSEAPLPAGPAAADSPNSDAASSADIRQEPPRVPSLEQQARAMLALPAGFDRGVAILRTSLLRALEPAADPDPFLEPMPSTDFLHKSSEFNPARVKLSQADTQAVESLIAEYGPKLRLARRDEHLADRLSLFQAIQRGDFHSIPNDQDASEVERRVRDEALERKPNGQWLSGMLPGADFSHRRFVHLDSEQYPLAFAAQAERNRLRAEFEAAVRAIFQEAARRKR